MKCYLCQRESITGQGFKEVKIVNRLGDHVKPACDPCVGKFLRGNPDVWEIKEIGTSAFQDYLRRLGAKEE